MYVEKRRAGKSVKYYLVHSYREKGEVRKIRRYLGLNLSKAELEKRKRETKKIILDLVEELNTEIFNFSLSDNQISKLNNYSQYLKIHHLEQFNWTRFTEDFVYNTNAIEGSTIQLSEVEEIVEKRKHAIGWEEIEAKNVAKAVEYILKSKEELSLDLIKKLHKICFEGTKHFAGKFRDVEVVVKNSRGEILHSGVHVSRLSGELNDLIDWHAKNKDKFKPLVLAAIIHNQFEHIHPFQDGNGRVGRLLLNFILLRNKFPPINILLEDRAEYYASLQEYSRNFNLKPTIVFLVKQYKKMLKRVPTKLKR